MQASHFSDSTGRKKFLITHTITCTTTAIIYQAVCPCELIYVGLTSREFRKRIREHILGIEAARQVQDESDLKTIPRHFRQYHNCDSTLLRFKAIDRVLYQRRGGNWKKVLAQKEIRWIYELNTCTPYGLNESASFAPFL